ncbi:MAG: hemerythrin family protein [Acidobacteria bacterium]|nr:hemerythrin family protein [Acidobacteriota bacterium]
MALIEWSDALLIGVEEVDRQHRHLVEILNRLHEAMQTGGKSRDVVRVMQDVVRYTKYHFETEERYMAAAGYPELAAHRLKHRAMVAKVGAFSEEVLSGKSTVTMRLMTFLKEWLSRHILETDKRFGEYMARKYAA